MFNVITKKENRDCGERYMGTEIVRKQLKTTMLLI